MPARRQLNGEARQVAVGVAVFAAPGTERGQYGQQVDARFGQAIDRFDHRFEDDVGARLADAIAGSGVRRVVLLSGLNAHLKMGTSLGAAMMEDRLNALGLDELVHLRASFFMENFVKGMGFVQQSASGVFATPFRGDLPMPLIAAADIGQRVAALLGAADFPSNRVVELHGGGHYTLAEASAILGKAIGREVSYRVLPFADARAGMVLRLRHGGEPLCSCSVMPDRRPKQWVTPGRGRLDLCRVAVPARHESSANSRASAGHDACC